MEKRCGWLKFGVSSYVVGIPRLLSPSPLFSTLFKKRGGKRKVTNERIGLVQVVLSHCVVTFFPPNRPS